MQKRINATTRPIEGKAALRKAKDRHAAAFLRRLRPSRRGFFSSLILADVASRWAGSPVNASALVAAAREAGFPIIAKSIGIGRRELSKIAKQHGGIWG